MVPLCHPQYNSGHSLWLCLLSSHSLNGYRCIACQPLLVNPSIFPHTLMDPGLQVLSMLL